jgi:hypothetical protein
MWLVILKEWQKYKSFGKWEMDNGKWIMDSGE